MLVSRRIAAYIEVAKDTLWIAPAFLRRFKGLPEAPPLNMKIGSVDETALQVSRSRGVAHGHYAE
jgi:hypothetical protein